MLPESFRVWLALFALLLTSELGSAQLDSPRPPAPVRRAAASPQPEALQRRQTTRTDVLRRLERPRALAPRNSPSPQDDDDAPPVLVGQNPSFECGQVITGRPFNMRSIFAGSDPFLLRFVATQPGTDRLVVQRQDMQQKWALNVYCELTYLGASQDPYANYFAVTSPSPNGFTGSFVELRDAFTLDNSSGYDKITCTGVSNSDPYNDVRLVCTSGAYGTFAYDVDDRFRMRPNAAMDGQVGDTKFEISVKYY